MDSAPARRRLWRQQPRRLRARDRLRQRSDAVGRILAAGAAPRHARVHVAGPDEAPRRVHTPRNRSSDRLVGRAPVRLRADGARDQLPWDWSWSSCWRSRCSEPGAGGSESLSRGAQLWRLPAVPSDSSLSDTRSPQNQSGKPPQWAAPAETERAAAGPSVFDLSVSGRPPAASEGVGPPSLKTKTNSKTAKISLRERHCGAARGPHVGGCVPTPIRGVDPELTRGCALGPPARLQPVDKSCHQQSRWI